jgi:imidazole glycerol-phosphate synthase subunit HisH
MGNTASILNMLFKVGLDAQISFSPDKLSDSTAIILPGVGAFDQGMNKIRDSGVYELLEELVVHRKKPFLGICLGMQMLFESSEEGKEKGLGWLSGNVRRFDFSDCDQPPKIPHMGWNTVDASNNNFLFDGLHDENRFYFVHSFHVECKDVNYSVASTQYGYDFTCSVQKENIFGVQFHPEKSHRFGMTFFKNFSSFLRC